eukprot:TRINITY_DN6502_c0_g1_i1.p1 TRINITY_DN6502_c0_g1~~TRINITY_DN6502_c0_g1_i1.p1  ORF type:complete len:219 (+),score=40.36 TRINITY_DN6502_c0_g1_i1:71-727(+)
MDPSLREKIRSVNVSDLADACVALNVMPCHVQNVRFLDTVKTDGPIVGLAHTIQYMIGGTAATLPKSATHHVDTCPEGSFVVVAAPQSATNACWGGLMTARAKALGAQGVIVDGYIRDVKEQRELAFPVFSKGTAVHGTAPFLQVSGVGVPVVIGGVTCRSGDVVVGDEDGVIVVPHEKISAIVDKAIQSAQADQRCMEDLLKGRSITETFAEHRGKK